MQSFSKEWEKDKSRDPGKYPMLCALIIQQILFSSGFGFLEWVYPRREIKRIVFKIRPSCVHSFVSWLWLSCLSSFLFFWDEVNSTYGISFSVKIKLNNACSSVYYVASNEHFLSDDM